MTSGDYVSSGPVSVKSAVPASLTTGNSGSGKSPSTNSTSTIVASGRSTASAMGGFRDSRRGSVPVIVPGRK